MHIIPKWLLWTPGIYTLLVALFAGVVPTLKWYQCKPIKILYAICLALLCGLEIASIRNDRAEQNHQHDTDMGQIFAKLDSMLSKADLIQSALSRRDSIEQDLLKETRRPQPESVGALKLRALNLAKDVSQFYYERALVRPIGPSSVELSAALNSNDIQKLEQREETKQKAWEQQTETVYQTNFAPPVKYIVEQLHAKGVFDERKFNGNVCAAPNYSDILRCAAQIQNAAQQLPY
jgi:hypothetical protein